MSRAYNPRVIEELRDRIAHLEGSAAKKTIVLPFGVREMDERLPGGGLPYGALHEIAGGGAGTVDGAAAALFAAGIAARSRPSRPEAAILANSKNLVGTYPA